MSTNPKQIPTIPPSTTNSADQQTMLQSNNLSDNVESNAAAAAAAAANQAVEDALTAVVSAGVMEQSIAASSSVPSATPSQYFSGAAAAAYKAASTPAKGGIYSATSTPAAGYLHASHHHSQMNSSALSSAKRRGRPRGWTDARVRQMLSFLESHYQTFKNEPDVFYGHLAESLGEDVDDAEAREKLEKMLNHYENARRRNDYNWKWFRALNQVLKNPSIPDEAYTVGGQLRYQDDTESLAEDDDDLMEGGAGGEKRAKSTVPMDPEALARLGLNGVAGMAAELRNKHHRNKAKFDSRYRILEKNLMKNLDDLRDLHAKYGAAFYQIDDDLVVVEKALAILGATAAPPADEQ